MFLICWKVIKSLLDGHATSGHPPLSSRKSWKGHLFTSHGIKSAETPKTRTEVTRRVEKKTLLPAVDGSLRVHLPVFEDISNDESDELHADVGKCATVSSIFCVFVGTSASADIPSSEAPNLEAESLRMDEKLRTREMNIIETLM